jgi:hypothetical protein
MTTQCNLQPPQVEASCPKGVVGGLRVLGFERVPMRYPLWKGVLGALSPPLLVSGIGGLGSCAPVSDRWAAEKTSFSPARGLV